MIVDSSVVLAILLQEPGWQPLVEHITDADGVAGIGTPTLVETGTVLTARLGAAGKSLLARFVQESGMRDVVFTAAHWPVAIDAFLRFGKGRHPAGLSFGNCLTYATALLAREPLLCVGDDFRQTDLPVITPT